MNFLIGFRDRVLVPPAEFDIEDRRLVIRSSCVLFALCAFFCVDHPTFGQSTNPSSSSMHQWASFRNGGSSRLPADIRLPHHWSPEKGVSWQSELPGYGQSSPIIMDDKILVTAVEGDQKEANLVVCLDRETGEQAWRLSRPTTLPGPSNYMYSRAAPTPVADDEHVFAFFESGDMFCVHLENGSLVWEQDVKKILGDLKSRHGLGSSLAQTDKLVFLNLEHDGPSSLLAIRKSDGEVEWKSERPSGSSWSSPVVIELDDQSQVVVSSAGESVGFDVETGKQLWKIEDLAGNTVPSPMVDGNRIYLGARKPEFGSTESAAKSNLCLEFKDGQTKPEVVWRSRRCITDYASPVASGDYLYLINGSGVLGCLNRHSGEELFRERLGIECWATPIVCDGHIFVFGKNGRSVVLRADGTFAKVAENSLWDTSNPPSPVSYREFFPSSTASHGHGGNHGHGKEAGKHSAGHSKSSNPSHGHGNPGAGMLAGLLKADLDGDEVLSGDEIPQRLRAVLDNIDLDHDGKLQKSELKKMAESFAAKRKGSRDSSRDPIVYGVAADANGILIRTGTRLFAVNGEDSK